MNTCFICNNIIGLENNSKEHIIPNSIGGRKIVRNFICIDCNNMTGETWDSELFKQLALFCTMFGIERQRGDVAPLKVKTLSGKEYIQFNDGTFQLLRPKFFTQVLEDKKIKISIQARTQKEALQILKGIAKKHNLSDTNIECIKNEIVIKDSYLNEPIGHSINFGGEKAGRSVVKTALALAFDAGINPFECEAAINYLINNGEACFGYYYEKDLIENREIGCPLHCVKIQADKKSKKIFGYVEYFGFMRMVILLSDNYCGENIEAVYAIDPMKGTLLNLQIKLNFSNEDIQQIYNDEKYDIENYKSAIGAIMSRAVAFSQEREFKRVMKKAVEHGQKFHDSSKSEEENANNISLKIIEYLQPYIERNVLNK
ncbi:HNH endonuclease [Acinetobacter faecalis]|uniref:HNH endonuclease n=1 Tax=Acinetobacter faecalis TaxID=2665161 RepID=UPI002A91C9A5|nr:HNH endonuclease [Acinetobacter faecalis]MDY6467031.1 HNH endonuclease [Acinetobacter faecalis]MDY6481175.1 HNH endonuclease [Acinetobacter faecalis]